MALCFQSPTNKLDALSILDDTTSVIQLLAELATGYESDGMGLSTGTVRGLVVVLMSCRKALHAAAEVLDRRQGTDPNDVEF